ncbi:MAG: hypothetical protein RLZZ347_199 [Candidatus Parcubacteria bacterium]|jgi:hypothetical protein
MKKQAFLGGSCNPTVWRAEIAIPAFLAAGVAFYNPQVDDWNEKDAAYKAAGIVGGITEVEGNEKRDSQELLFVIDSQTRAIASILEATEYAASGRQVTLVINNIPDGTVVENQTITGRELKDLNRARSYLLDVAKRHSGNVSVFPDVESAVAHLIEKLK